VDLAREHIAPALAALAAFISAPVASGRTHWPSNNEKHQRRWKWSAKLLKISAV